LVLTGLVAVAAGCAHPPPARRPVTPAGPSLRLLTYNLNFGIAGDEPTIVAIRDADADLVLLQETNRRWERALRAALAGAYPQMVFRNRGDAGGLAVLSRLPLIEIEFLPPVPEGWFAAARLVVETSFGRVQALSIHLHPPVSDGGSFVSGHFTTPAIRVAEIRGFVARLSPDYPTLVAGDFNEEEDGGAVKVLLDRGMRSALAGYAPEQPTWRWKTVLGTLHRQLDHVFYDARLVAVWAEVRTAGRSDHLPVIAVLVPTVQTPLHR
jgi:endonuclease/exonuclease/phosphatase (EEP) superfamily protein YafD